MSTLRYTVVTVPASVYVPLPIGTVPGTLVPKVYICMYSLFIARILLVMCFARELDTVVYLRAIRYFYQKLCKDRVLVLTEAPQ